MNITEQQPIRIAAVIPTFNRAASLKNILHCLEQQAFGDYRVSLLPIVVVDGSTDGTLDMLALEFPGVHDRELPQAAEGNSFHIFQFTRREQGLVKQRFGRATGRISLGVGGHEFGTPKTGASRRRKR